MGAPFGVWYTIGAVHMYIRISDQRAILTAHVVDCRVAGFAVFDVVR